jgi:hypothetical protein
MRLDAGRNLGLAIATTAPIAVPMVTWPAASRLFDDPQRVGQRRSTA